MKTMTPNAIVILAAALICATEARSATLTVTNLNDSGPGTLRQSITDAASGDTINFAVSGTVRLTNGEMAIAKDITLHGPGATNLTVDANFRSRVFNVTGGTNVISGLTITKGFAGSLSPEIFDNGGGIRNIGNLTLNNCVFSTNLAYGSGGGIFNAGTLTVSNNTLLGNIGISGGAIDNLGGALTLSHCVLSGNSGDADGDGGGIANRAGLLTIRDSTLSDNSSPGGNGGGLFNSDASTAVVSNCIFSGNSAARDSGGAVDNEGGGTFMALQSTFVNNFGYIGGGLANYGLSMKLSNCTVSGNSTRRGGAGIFHHGNSLSVFSTTIGNNGGGTFIADGGGIYSALGTVSLNNCTISGNLGASGAGLQVTGGSVVLITNCTVIANRSDSAGRGVNCVSGSSIRVCNTIVAQNGSLFFGGTASDVAGDFMSGGYNLIGANDGSTGFINGLAHDLAGSIASPLDPTVGPLQDNGGPTWTHALLPGSPAIDAGHSGGLATDQRGGARAVITTTNALPGDGSDIGAFEAGGYVRLTSITRTNSDTHLRFTTDPSAAYRVQRRVGFGTGDWSDLPGPVSGTGAIVPFLDAGAESAQGFYRVRVGP